MILEPLDGHQEQNLMINISVERSGEMVNMSVDGKIPTKTLWNASLLAYGCQSDTVVKGVELSEFVCFEIQAYTMYVDKNVILLYT